MEEIRQVGAEEGTEEAPQALNAPSESTPNDLEAALELIEGGGKPVEEPETWHGGPSFARLLLMPFGVSASKFLASPRRVRELVFESLLNEEKRRAFRSATLCLIVGLGFVAILSTQWLPIACGGVALKAGVDMGRFVSRQRALKSTLLLTEKDLEVEKPAEDAS